MALQDVILYMWVNWPCNDNYKTGLIMGGHNTILHTGIDGHKYEGIILNPMQHSEPSKVAIFTAADYCWKPWMPQKKATRHGNIPLSTLTMLPH